MAIWVENRKMFPPLYILHPSEGVPFGIWYRRWESKRRTDTGLQQRPRLRIASRCNKNVSVTLSSRGSSC